jgi:phage terminase large subunit-like protein
MIAKHRVSQPPALERIVVGVDPHTSKGVGETGIVTAGLATIGGKTHGYPLSDDTVGGRPEQWALQVLAAYGKHRADRIVAEKNQGGDMVEHTIRSVEGGQNAPVTLVWASRGKRARAEPISALYEQGRIHHVGTLGELEDELCTWVPGETAESPNRLDALVWALTELMIGTGQPAGAIVDVPKNTYKMQRRKSRLWA